MKKLDYTLSLKKETCSICRPKSYMWSLRLLYWQLQGFAWQVAWRQAALTSPLLVYGQCMQCSRGNCSQCSPLLGCAHVHIDFLALAPPMGSLPIGWNFAETSLLGTGLEWSTPHPIHQPHPPSVLHASWSLACTFPWGTMENQETGCSLFYLLPALSQ